MSKLLPIPGYPGYLASSKGFIYSLKEPGTGKIGAKKRRLPGYDNAQGRLRVALYKEGIKCQEQISRLIALTFIPNPQNYPQVLHNDNDYLNNNYRNLRWGTQSGNIKQAYKDGRLRPPLKLPEVIRVEIAERLRAGESGRKLSKEYCIGRVTVNRIKRHYV